MKTMVSRIMTALFLFCAACLSVQAGDKRINIQGRLTDETGVPITGQKTLTFNIYDSTSSLVSRYTEQDVINIGSDGIFNVTLGTSNPSALDAVAFDKQYYVDFQVDGETLTPLQPLGASCYALGSISDFHIGKNMFVLGNSTVTGNAYFSGNLSINGSILNLHVSGNSTVGGNSACTGNATFSGDVSFLGGVGGTSNNVNFKNSSISMVNTSFANTMTNLMASNVYGKTGALSSTHGGLIVDGVSNNDSIPLYLRGTVGATVTTSPAIQLTGGKYNGVTSGGLVGDSERLLQIFNWNEPRMTMLGNGNLGLGTTTPSSKLNIKDGSINMGVSGFTNTMTNLLPSDVYGKVGVLYGPYGGMYIEGVTSTDFIPLYLRGTVGATTVTNPAIMLVGGKSNGGTSGAPLGNGEILLQVANWSQAMMTVLGNGNVGISVTNPGYRLTINGSAYCTDGAWVASDERLKSNIESVSGNTLNKVIQLNAIRYTLKKDEVRKMLSDKSGNDKNRLVQAQQQDAEQYSYCDRPQVGVSAQELEKSFPELVRTDQNGYKAVDYGKLSVVLLEAIKEQQKQIEALQKAIAKNK